MTKEERVQIFRHTTDTVRRGKYKANDGTDKEFYREDEMLKSTKFYSKGI